MHEHIGLLESLQEVLAHIKDVQKEVIEHSNKSVLSIGRFLDEEKITAPDDVVQAIQYQDIMSQQLVATTGAIDSIENNISRYIRLLQEDTGLVYGNIQSLNTKLQDALDDAKKKKERFTGKMNNNEDSGSEDEIEFF